MPAINCTLSVSVDMTANSNSPSIGMQMGKRYKMAEKTIFDRKNGTSNPTSYLIYSTLPHYTPYTIWVLVYSHIECEILC